MDEVRLSMDLYRQLPILRNANGQPYPRAT